MKANQSYYRRRSSLTTVFAISAAAILGILGILLTLSVLGVPLNPFATAEVQEQEDPFVVRIPVNVRAIEPYTKVSRGDMLDPETGWLRYMTLPPESAVGMEVKAVDSAGTELVGKVTAYSKSDSELIFDLETGQQVTQSQVHELGGVLLRPGSIIGRVLKKEKRPGLGFRDTSFYPAGTPEGIAGATPMGMRGIVVPAEKLSGVHGLNAGDHIDLIANVPLKDLGSFGSRGSAATLHGAKEDRTEPIMLAQNALILKPVYTRPKATAASQPGQPNFFEVALAVGADDVIPLQSAINRDLEIMCVTRSMQQPETPTEDQVDATAGTNIRIPVTSRDILAYEVVTMDHFQNPATREVGYHTMSAEHAGEMQLYTDITQIIGAVVRHDIPKGCAMSQHDVLHPGHHADQTPTLREAGNGRHTMFRLTAQPIAAQPGPTTPPVANRAGDRPSISEFLPPGYRGVAVPWNRLYGAEHLRIGDEIDLAVAFRLKRYQDVEEKETSAGVTTQRRYEQLQLESSLRTWDETLGNRGEPWIIASAATVIGPVGFPPPDPASRFLGEALYAEERADDASTPTGPPIILGIPEQDADAFATALVAEDAMFTAIIHSGQSQNVGPDRKQVVISARDLNAYETLSEEALQLPHSRRFQTRIIGADHPEFQNALTIDQLRPYIGRTLKNVRPRFSFFHVDDFMDQGVAPGVAAGAQPGHAVIIVRRDLVDGLELFGPQDRLALVAAGQLESCKGCIVHGGAALGPAAQVVSKEITFLRKDDRGIALSVHLSDVANVQAALGQCENQGGEDSVRLAAVALSRLTLAPSQTSSAAGNEAIPNRMPVAEARKIQTIVGRQGQLHVFPSREGSR